MTPLQLELTKLIGKKELTFGCIILIKNEYIYKVIEKQWDFIYCTIHQLTINREDVTTIIRENVLGNPWREIIGHPATLSDFHRWIEKTNYRFKQDIAHIEIWPYWWYVSIPYDSYKDLLLQSDETLKQIISLISNNQ